MDGFEFWKRVDKIRPKKDLKVFAKENGLDYVRLTNQRSDCRIPKLEDAYKLSAALGCSIEYLINGEENHKYNARITAIADALEADPDKLDAVETLLFNKKVGQSLKLS